MSLREGRREEVEMHKGEEIGREKEAIGGSVEEFF